MGYRLAILPIAPGIDSLVAYACNHASATGLAWGREFVSTCGPYSYLIASMDVGNLLKRTITFNLLLVVATGLAIATDVQSVPGLRAGARIALVIVLAYAVSSPRTANRSRRSRTRTGPSTPCRIPSGR
jgi:hypothetical protein